MTELELASVSDARTSRLQVEFRKSAPDGADFTYVAQKGRLDRVSKEQLLARALDLAVQNTW